MIKWNDLPPEIQEKMLERQVEQGNRRNPEIFKENMCAGSSSGGFDWDSTIEDEDFWHNIINEGWFDDFFYLYPTIICPIKPEYHKEFKKIFRVNKIPELLTSEMISIMKKNDVYEKWLQY